MAKPKARPWLRESFRDGVDEQERARRGVSYCWLAQHDPRHRPCSARRERFHFIPRQRVENAMWEALHDARVWDRYEEPSAVWFTPTHAELWGLILLAAWDPRNGGIACEHHHRRFDNHATPSLIVPLAALPAHVIAFCNDYDFIGAGWFADRFPASGPSGSVGPVSRSIQSN